MPALIIAGPSGAGKDTLARMYFEKHPGAEYSVSATTRTPRKGERDGHDYFFLTEEEFMRRVETGGLLEWERVHGNFYGTPGIDAGKETLFILDVRGAMNMKRILAERGIPSMTVFVKAPSTDELRRRLEKRGEAPESIERRLQAASEELGHEDEFDLVVVNDDRDEAFRRLEEGIENFFRGPVADAATTP